MDQDYRAPPLERLARHMGGSSDTARRYVEFPGIGVGIGDELRDRFRWNRKVRHEQLGNAGDGSDRRDVSDKIKFKIFVKRRVNRVGRSDQEQRVAVGRRTYARLGADIPTCTRSVVDDERRAEPLR